MEENALKELINTAQNFTLPAYEEIPDVGLYLEQVVRYIAGYVETSTLPPLTGSMISNYVKKKIISNPVKKMYYREQIAYLLFIAFAKNAIQIEDMQYLFDVQQKDYSIKDAYEFFRMHIKQSMMEVFEGRNKTEKDMNTTQFDQRVILKNICITVAYRIYLDQSIHALVKEKETTE